MSHIATPQAIKDAPEAGRPLLSRVPQALGAAADMARLIDANAATRANRPA